MCNYEIVLTVWLELIIRPYLWAV